MVATITGHQYLQNNCWLDFHCHCQETPGRSPQAPRPRSRPLDLQALRPLDLQAPRPLDLQVSRPLDLQAQSPGPEHTTEVVSTTQHPCCSCIVLFLCRYVEVLYQRYTIPL